MFVKDVDLEAMPTSIFPNDDNRGRHVLSSETIEVEGYKYGLMAVFRSFLKSAYADCLSAVP